MFWPTAAAACWVARSSGRSLRLRKGTPVEIAPDDTRMTRVPLLCSFASASTSFGIWPAFSPLTDEDPTLTTMRRAFFTMGRLVIFVTPESRFTFLLQLLSSGSLRVHALGVGFSTLRG